MCAHLYGVCTIGGRKDAPGDVQAAADVERSHAAEEAVRIGRTDTSSGPRLAGDRTFPHHSLQPQVFKAIGKRLRLN